MKGGFIFFAMTESESTMTGRAWGTYPGGTLLGWATKHIRFSWLDGAFAFRPIKIWNSDLVASKQPSRRVWFCQGLFSPGANKHLWLEEWRFFSRLSGTTTHRIVLFNWTWQWDGLVYWVFSAFWLTWCHSLWRGFQGIHGSSCRWPCSTCRCNRGVHCWSADA